MHQHKEVHEVIKGAVVSACEITTRKLGQLVGHCISPSNRELLTLELHIWQEGVLREHSFAVRSPPSASVSHLLTY